MPLDELRDGLGDGVDVKFAAGFETSGGEDDDALREAAVALAGECDHVVVFLGLPAEAESESSTGPTLSCPRTNWAWWMRWPGWQAAGRGAGERLGRPAVDLGAQGGRQILECWLSGQAAGGAAADLLLGKANPSGKLAETIPLRLEDNSSYLNFPGDPGVVRYGEGVFIGYRAYDRCDQTVGYPFGFGLSYTTFEISEVQVEISGSVAGGDLSVEVTASVANTGSVAGAEVVQVYLGDVKSTVARPVRELKGFTKVALEPGESTSVSIVLLGDVDLAGVEID